MHPALLVACVLANVPLYLAPQDLAPDARWPTHAVIALPQGWAKASDLYILENDRPLLAQIEDVARWPDGSPKWVHAYATYRYEQGKPARYVLMRAGQPPPAMPKSPLVVTDKPDAIHVDTGVIKLVIPRPFAGITLCEHQGQRVIDGAGGPSLVDARGIAWHAMHDAQASVVVEQQGPAQVTIKAAGWYQTTERRVEPFCQFVTRITAFAGSPLVKIDHATIFAGDMRENAIAELGFRFALPGARGYQSGTRSGEIGDDTSAVYFVQPRADAHVTLVEQGKNSVRQLSDKPERRQDPGWFCAPVADSRVALLTKDFWQKCPKEVKVGKDEIVYYAWPRHGELAVPDETATRPEGVYKFQCFQTGRLLDSRLPSEYFTSLELQTDTTECKAAYARAANLVGAAIHNEFALVFLPAAGAGAKSDDIAGLQRLYADSPIARTTPTAIASSGVLGPVVPTGTEFPEMGRAVRDGMLGYARSIERYGDYGWAIYGNTHHEELMNPSAAGLAGGRPSLHRVWSNNHYQHVSTSWRLFALDGDPRLLRWARICTDNYASIGQVHYDPLRGRIDGNNQRHPGPAVKFHNPGAFWHCKAFVPWAGRDYGMDSNDLDSGLTGHWPDPSGLLFAWLFDANRWAKDGYDLWLANVKFPTLGTRREINTTLVHAITAYEYQPTPELLATVKSIAARLRSMPIIEQRPGPIWEPTWLSRYHELFPDDAAFNKFLLESADALGFGIDNWSLALSATAYRMTKDEKYLRRHAGTLARTARQVFYDDAADKRWDRYGFSPGPDRDRHFMLQWHRFAAALKEANISSLPPPDEPGQYFCSMTRFDNAADISARGTRILLLRDGAESTLSLEAIPLGGGGIAATSLEVSSPAKRSLLSLARLPMSAVSPTIVRTVRPSTWEVTVERHPLPAGEAGLYNVVLGSNGIGLFQPLTSGLECELLRSSKLANWPEPVVYQATLARGYLVPLTRGGIQLTFTAMGDRDGSYVSLAGAKGQAIVARHVRAGDSVKVKLNERGGVPGPWLVDVFSDHSGYLRLSIVSDVEEPLLFGRNLEDIQKIRQKLGR